MKKRAMEKVLKRKQELINLEQQRVENLIKKALTIPEISNAQKEYTNAQFNCCINHDANKKQIIDEKYKKYINALKKYNLSENDFKPQPICPICNDTGSVNGKTCKCIWDEYIKQLEIESNIVKTAPFTFEDNKPSTIKDTNQKAIIKKLYPAMEKYVSKYPNININNITLIGQTGTGKSALASAMARRMVQNGNSALFMSAFELNTILLKYHLAPIESRENILHDILTCDMLVIDDLGTEPIYKKVTIEYLLLLLNQRTINKLSTIITTNLNTNQLLNKYHERIYSRLSDKKHSQILQIIGSDLRNNN